MSHARRRTAAAVATALCLGSGALTAAPAATGAPRATGSAVAAPGTTPPVVGLTAAGALAALEAGETTSVALVEAYLARIDAYDDPYDDQPGLRAVVTTSPVALQTAALLDAERAQGISRGPLHGVPVLVKDNYATYDMPTTAGSAALAGYRTARDSTAVARLRAAGAIVIAKANMSEFAWHGTYTLSSVRGRTANPYDQRNSASGSSGGTAAGVAAAFAAAGTGTDTCGSIIGPSAHQSLVGYRPTSGLTSNAGIVPLSVPQDVSGPMTLTVEDAAIVLGVLAGPDPADPRTLAVDAGGSDRYVESLSDTALAGARVGVFAWDFGDATPEGPRPGTDEALALVEAAKADLAAQGAELVEVPLTRELLREVLVSAGYVDMRSSIDAFLAATEATWPAGLAELTEPADRLTFSDVVADGRVALDQETIDSWLALPDVPNPEYDAALAAQAAGRAAIDAFFAEHDLDAMAMPTSEAPSSPEWAGTSFCDLGANTGIPTVSVPAGETAAGLPVGLELAAPRGHDAELLAMAHDYEQATLHRDPPASVPELEAGTR